MSLRHRLAPVVLLLPILAGCVPAGDPGTGDPSTTSPPATVPAPSGWQAQMLVAVNAERATAGVRQLTLCASLGRAAQAHSADQAAIRVMSHTGSDGSTLRMRVERAGYLGWMGIAENVAAGHPDVTSVMAAWMASSGHRTNLLATATEHVGFGMARASDGTLYWTQDFGRSGTC